MQFFLYKTRTFPLLECCTANQYKQDMPRADCWWSWRVTVFCVCTSFPRPIPSVIASLNLLFFFTVHTFCIEQLICLISTYTHFAYCILTSHTELWSSKGNTAKLASGCQPFLWKWRCSDYVRSCFMLQHCLGYPVCLFVCSVVIYMEKNKGNLYVEVGECSVAMWHSEIIWQYQSCFWFWFLMRIWFILKCCVILIQKGVSMAYSRPVHIELICQTWWSSTLDRASLWQ